MVGFLRNLYFTVDGRLQQKSLSQQAHNSDMTKDSFLKVPIHSSGLIVKIHSCYKNIYNILFYIKIQIGNDLVGD